jgi:penicillin-binding protein 1A
MGVESAIPKEPSIALGTPDASLFEMVQAYGTFANRGRRPTPHYLDRIETADGKLIVKFDRPNASRFPQLMQTTYADMMIKMLQAVVDSGTGRRLRYEFGLGNDIGGKTGTTQNNSDGWFIGFTPKLVAGAWVGAETPQVHFRSTRYGQGGYSALPIWGKFMKKVNADAQLKDWRYGKFATPADSVIALMQCPHFLPEMPIFVNDLGLPDTPNLFQRIFHSLKGSDEEKQSQLERFPERRPGESDEEYLDRVHRKVQKEEVRDERREKRKDFWNKLLFGKDKDKEKSNDKKQQEH